MKDIYDIIIIGSGAAGLFTSIQAPFSSKKLILEKTDKIGVKVLLSGGERANVSNMDIDPTRDYFGQNRKAMISIYNKFQNWDLMGFFSENGINIVEEDRGRLILESGDSKELLNLLVKKSKDNNTQIRKNKEVVDIKKLENDLFEIIISNGEKYISKKVIITSGGKSFSQVGTTGDGYTMAEKFGHTIITPYRGLCGLATREDLSELSGISCNVNIELLDGKNTIYSEKGPLLFTHFGISGPIIFNTAIALGELINSKNIENYESYFKDNIFIKLTFDLDNLPKRIIKKFNLSEENKETIFNILDYRSWKEAKVTGGGIKLDELTNDLESKLVPGLYFAGEILDLTGKTGGFNLQLAWSSGTVVGDSL